SIATLGFFSCSHLVRPSALFEPMRSRIALVESGLSAVLPLSVPGTPALAPSESCTVVVCVLSGTNTPALSFTPATTRLSPGTGAAAATFRPDIRRTTPPATIHAIRYNDLRFCEQARRPHSAGVMAGMCGNRTHLGRFRPTKGI